MKLPFDFGLRFILRLVAPGALLAAISLPITRMLAELIYHGLSDGIVLLISGLIFGFALLLLDMPIYMLLEGRRFWPGWLRDLGVRQEAARLQRIQALAQHSNGARKTELDIIAAQYPIERSGGQPIAIYPTRLGNLLASFETYPTIKYGLDGVFYWPRLWVVIDKDLREELDSAQAVVDGAVYCSFAFGLATAVCLAYWLWLPAAAWWHWPASSLGCLLLSRLCYLLALPRYAQYGDLFAATFDQHQSKLNSYDFLPALDLHMQAGAVVRSEREKNRSRWRFLRWHRYRMPGASTNETVKGW